MGRYVYASSTASYFCGFRCVRCGKMNASVSYLNSVSSSSYGRLGATRAAASHHVSNSAEMATSEKVLRLLKDVNHRRDFHRLYAPHKCQACHARQPWRILRLLRLVLSAGGFYATLALLSFIAKDENPLFYLLSAVIALACWWGYNFLHNWMANRKLGAINDDACYPLLISGSIPRSIREDDPRLLAILHKQQQAKK